MEHSEVNSAEIFTTIKGKRALLQGMLQGICRGFDGNKGLDKHLLESQGPEVSKPKLLQS